MASFIGLENARGRNAAEDAKTVAEIEAAARAGGVPRAIEMALAGLKNGLVHPLLLNLRSYWLEGQGRNEEALADLRRAVFLAPNDPLLQNSYGLCLLNLNRKQDAVAALRTAVALAPEFMQAQFNLGSALENSGELNEARLSYERTIALQPDFGDALARLAGLAARRGDWEQTRKFSEQALAHEPANATALIAVARMTLATGDLERADSAISTLLRNTNLAAFDRTMGFSFLGDLRHMQGRFAEAFDAYDTSNRGLRELHSREFDGPGVESASAYAVWLAEQFEKAPSATWGARRDELEGADGGSIGHVFLVGFPRSGTTLLENILGSHPDVVSLEERNTLGDATRDYFANLRGLGMLANLKGNDLVRARARYWQHVRDFGVDVQGKVFVDKHPLMSTKLPLVSRLFPTAKIVFAVRDPRDVVLSCFRRLFTMNPSMYEFLDLERTARYYYAVMRLSAIYRARLNLDWHELRNEKLVEDFEGEARKVCEFIGVEWNDKMHDFAQHATIRPIATPSALQVMKGLNRDGIGQWRNYREQLAPVLPILQPWVEKFGYPAD
jgi:tetratricopeptide (TPR) repeat protein